MEKCHECFSIPDSEQIVRFEVVLSPKAVQVSFEMLHAAVLLYLDFETQSETCDF